MYYYSEDDLERAKKYVKKLEISYDKVIFISLKENSPFTRKVYFYKK